MSELVILLAFGFSLLLLIALLLVWSQHTASKEVSISNVPPTGSTGSTLVSTSCNGLDSYMCTFRRKLDTPSAKITLCFHGHSIPATYNFAGTREISYPYLLFRKFQDQFPKVSFSVLNTSIPSENSSNGAARFKTDVMSKTPDIVFLDFGINDGPLNDSNVDYWKSMIKNAHTNGIAVVALTNSAGYGTDFENVNDYMAQIAQRIRIAAQAEGAPLADNFKIWGQKAKPLLDYITSTTNAHPNKQGHQLIADAVWGTLCASLAIT